MGVWGPRVAGLVGAGGVRRCVASRALSRSTARSEEKCARKALATESGTPYARNNFRAKMSEIRSMAPKWIWCASKLSRALDAKATSRSRAGGCWPAVERTPMPHSTATARTHAPSRVGFVNPGNPPFPRALGPISPEACPWGGSLTEC